MGPSITSGASIRSQRRAAIKVIVFQWPCGALATSLRPFGPQPRSGVIFVLIHVSSMKTRRDGSMLAWRAFQRSRLRATSGRSCSLANRLFFETQPFLANESPNGAPIGLDPALGKFGRQAPRREPTGAKTLTQPDGDVSRERARLAASDRSRRNRARLPPRLPPLGRPRRIDAQRLANRPDRLARLKPRQSAFAQILPIIPRLSKRDSMGGFPNRRVSDSRWRAREVRHAHSASG